MAQAPPLTPPTRRRGRPGARERRESRSSPPPTGRAKSVPDTAVTLGVRRGTTGTPTGTPSRRLRPIIAGQAPFVVRGGSRIRTLVGISRRIYRPLPCDPTVVAHSTALRIHRHRPRTPMTVDRFRRIGAVCGPSQRTKRHPTTRCDVDQRRLLPLFSAGFGAVIRRLAGSLGRCPPSAGRSVRRWSICRGRTGSRETCTRLCGRKLDGRVNSGAGASPRERSRRTERRVLH